jgi:protein ImuB
MPFACIFVPDFPVEAILRSEPELRAQAVAVLEGKPPLQKVFALNEKSRCAGIEIGMSKVQVEACSGLVLRLRSLTQEAAAHAALLDGAQSFSPAIEDMASDTILLDLAGLEPLFGPLPKIARDVARRVSDLGLETNVAVASNPDCALLTARGFSGVTVIPTGEEAERLGNLPLEVLFAGLSDAEQQEKAAQFLETLSRWGIRNLRALAGLPEIALGERLGQEGVRLQQLARGAVCRKLVAVEPPLIFKETVELEYPLMLLEPLAFLLRNMLDQLCSRLGARALMTQELRLRLELEQGYIADEATEARDSESDSTQGDQATTSHVGTDSAVRPSRAQARQQQLNASPRTATFTRTLHLPVPMLDAEIFLKLLQLDLKAHPPGAPIRKIHLAAEPARPRNSQGGLFLPTTPEPEKLELTLARISGIVGENKVGSVELLDTHRPEGFCMQHFAPDLSDHSVKNSVLTRHSQSAPEGQKSLAQRVSAGWGVETSEPGRGGTLAQAQIRSGTAQDNAAKNPVTALRIFRPPLRATVILQDGKPAHIECHPQKEIQGKIIWLAGPWRSSGDWWEQDGWARDEWDIALQAEEGIALYRLVRDLLKGQWFVEGTYD